MERDLLDLEQQEDPANSVDAIFRCAYTIKGSAGLFGLDHIVRFTHVVESLLDDLSRAVGQLTVSSDLVTLLLPCGDHIRVMIEAVAGKQFTGDEYEPNGQH